MYAVDYSEKAVAVFGPSTELNLVKDHLKEKYNARFNNALIDPTDPCGVKTPGYIISKKKKDELLTDLRIKMKGAPPPLNLLPTSRGSCDISSSSSSSTVSGTSSKDFLPSTVIKEDSGSDTGSSISLPVHGQYIVNYSEKAIAVFGDTKKISGDLKNAGGKWNPYLKNPLIKEADANKNGGWIFSRKALDVLQNQLKLKLVGDDTHMTKNTPTVAEGAFNAIAQAEMARLRAETAKEIANTPPEQRILTEVPPAPLAPSSTSSSTSSAAPKVAAIPATGFSNAAAHGIYICDYGEKCIAVFGNSKPFKQALSQLPARFNPSLTDPRSGAKAAGWIVRKHLADALHLLFCGSATARHDGAGNTAISPAKAQSKRKTTDEDDHNTCKKRQRYEDLSSDDDAPLVHTTDTQSVFKRMCREQQWSKDDIKLLQELATEAEWDEEELTEEQVNMLYLGMVKLRQIERGE